MAVIISSINLKGGVGKTALAVNFSAFCGMNNYRTLLIDLDPQTNATFASIGVGDWESHATNKGTVANLLDARRHTSAEGKTTQVQDIILKDVFKNVDLIPSHIDLFTVDLDLSGEISRETKLKRALKDVIDNYDIIVCDCPPNLTIPTQNALAMSTHYIIPVSLDFLSAIGIGLLINRVEELSKDLDRSLENAGIVISRVGRPAIHREETEATLRNEFKSLVLNNKISERSSVSESAAKTRPIFLSGDHKAIEEFSSVCKEILERIGYENS